MAVAAFAIVALFASTLLDGSVSWAILLGLRLLLSGLALLAAAASLHPGEAAHLGRTTRPLLLAVIPAAWLIVQVLPLPFAANPVWISAAGALPNGVWGHMTVDVPSTLFSMIGLLLAVLVALAVAAQTVDRARAEIALVSLGGAAILLPALSQSAHALSLASDLPDRLAALDCLIFAALLAIGCGTLAYERYETRHAGQTRARSRLLAVEIACTAVALCCIGTAALIGGTSHLLAAVGGLLIFSSMVASRRFGWGPWFVVAALAVVAFVYVSVATSGFGSGQGMSRSAAASSGIERQLMRDAPWVGTGGGTAPIISNLYRTLDDDAPFASSSSVSKLAVELGAPVSGVLLLLLCLLEFVLIRDALRRGRDSVYPILGASFLPTVLILAFANAGLFDWKVITIGAGILGLALCQSQSRTMVQ